MAISLAALAGYLFIVQGNSLDKLAATAVVSTKEVLKDEDAVNINLYDDKSYFNLKNDDPKKIAMIQVQVTLKCYKTLKVNKKVKVEEKVSAYSDEIKELVVRFFLTKTIDDVKNTQVMDKAKDDLKKQINTLLNEGEKYPEDIVNKVIFSEWLFQ
jgi:flagellar basal body-associated protein FliL